MDGQGRCVALTVYLPMVFIVFSKDSWGFPIKVRWDRGTSNYPVIDN